MATVINDLVTRFGFEGTTAPLDTYNDQLTGSIKLLGGMLVALNAAAAGFAYWADTVLTGVDALDALGDRSGVAVGAIQELNYIAGQTQSTAGAMESTIASLSTTIGQAAQQGSEDFARLGISVRDASGQVKTADTVLEEVRQRFGQLNLSLNEQKHFASALGIDESLLKMLNKTDSEMAQLRDRARELGTLTAEQTEQAAKYKASLNAMGFALDSIKQLVAVGVAPQFARLAEEFTDLLASNRDWIVDGIRATVDFLGDLLAAFNRLLPVFGVMVGGFLAMKVAALGFGGVLGIVLSPAILITAAIVALLAIIDDLIVAFQGGESVIADFFQEFLGVDIVKVMTDIVNAVTEMVASVWKATEPLREVFATIFSGWGKLFAGDINGAIDNVTAAFRKLGSWLSNLFTPIFNRIADAALSILPDWAVDLISSDRPAGDVANPNTIPAGSVTTNSATIDNRRVEQSNTVNVYTNDPDRAGQAVRDNLQRQLSDANTQLSPGGR